MARKSLTEDVAHARALHERDQLQQSVKWIDDNASTLCDRYPQVLKASFQKKHTGDGQCAVMTAEALNLDQLKQMNQGQVQERVEMTRTLQFILLTVEKPLHDMDVCICVLLGLDKVRPERNPLRPQNYISALQALWLLMAVPAQVRMVCMSHLSSALGTALRAFYNSLTQKLHRYGITALTLSDGQLPTSKPHQPARSNRLASGSVPGKSTVLTLDRLRGLLTGELDSVATALEESFDDQFSREFESRHKSVETAHLHDTDFAPTVPAAFESNQDVPQPDHGLTRIEQRSAPPLATQLNVRQQLMRRCQNLSQLLSLEVVALMVRNLVRDECLPETVRRVILEIEPALLQLALVDGRFFCNKRHPALKLLFEITQRGLAFRSIDEPEFGTYLMSLYRFVNPLARQPISSAQPFDQALAGLKNVWQEGREQTVSQMVNAVQALQHAEERNLLAKQMVAAMELIPEMQKVPSSVAEFLCGPWSQVMAFVELNSDGSSDDPGQYKDLVNSLLWSAQPELTRQNVAKLTKLLPKLLSKLREGLGLIGYPSLKTSAFFDILMKLHQRAFRSPDAGPESQNLSLNAGLISNREDWVAPTEAKASGFMDLPDDMVLPQAASDRVTLTDTSDTSDANDDELNSNEDVEYVSLAVGAWVELQHKGVWRRTQLTWISPLGTMYLFTNVHGQTQSMTQRSLNRLMVTNTLQVVSEQSIVDSALDAVVREAMLNSLDIRLI